MVKVMFTFGYGQVPGVPYYTIIEAESYEEARKIMEKRTLMYTFDYVVTDDELGAMVAKDGLRPVFWNETFRGWHDHP